MGTIARTMEMVEAGTTIGLQGTVAAIEIVAVEATEIHPMATAEAVTVGAIAAIEAEEVVDEDAAVVAAADSRSTEVSMIQAMASRATMVLTRSTKQRYSDLTKFLSSDLETCSTWHRSFLSEYGCTVYHGA